MESIVSIPKLLRKEYAYMRDKCVFYNDEKKKSNGMFKHANASLHPSEAHDVYEFLLNPQCENNGDGRGKDNDEVKDVSERAIDVDVYEIEACLTRQKILNRLDKKVVREIAKKGIVRVYNADERIVEQGDIGVSVFFLLCGSVSVVVNGRKVATRVAKECIGEMTVLDPTQKRSATLIAMEECRVLELDGKIFRKIYEKNINVLEGIALELALRLREHTRKITQTNQIPHVFIGSSSEYSGLASKLEKRLPHSGDIKATMWSNGVFELSKSNIESLDAEADHSDFAVFILSKDDLVKSRGTKKNAPRDNVLFELGLFMGRIGRDRTYAICCDKNVKIPSDLLGVTLLMMKSKDSQGVSECAKELRKVILSKGVK